MTTRLVLYGAKGGVGVTTSALGLAKALDAAMVQISHRPDAVMFAGSSDPGFPLIEAVRLDDALDALRRTVGDVVMDVGQKWGLVEQLPTLNGDDVPWRRVLVVQQDYPGLRLALGAPAPDVVLLRLDSMDRAIVLADVEAALPMAPVVVVTSDPAVGRMFDAGLLGRKLPQTWRRQLEGAVLRLDASAPA